MALANRRRFVFFGGHGASNLYSTRALCKIRENTRRSKIALSLLSRCHSAFIDEIDSLDGRTLDRLGLDVDKFSSPLDLLSPDTSFQTHGLIQMIVIVLAQLLHYVTDIESGNGRFEPYHTEIVEVDGFCSGLLTAAVVASSSNATMFSSFGVQAFRLAFWLGCRSFLECQSLETSAPEGSSWSLVVMGASVAKVRQEVEKLKVSDDCIRVRVSAISSDTVVSLSGPPRELAEIKRNFSEVTKFANVQAWYHGGENLRPVLEAVLKDQQRRKIIFPSVQDLVVPIRSSHNGRLVKADKESPFSLSSMILENILVKEVDWLSTSIEISNLISSYPQRTEAEIHSYGPSSKSLFADLRTKTVGKNITFADLSPFKMSDEVNIGENDVAIIGMGVNFPRGQGEDELWETLSTGLNAVSEIPNSRFDVSRYYEPHGSSRKRTMTVNKGAFLDDPFAFDCSFFNISPREARSMDPQQRVILKTTQAALDDAGYVPDSTPTFQRASIGCYMGIATGDYVDNLKNDIDIYYSPGTLRAFHSGKVSYMYKLSGPSLTIDTACSSSAVAIYQACRALQTGDCTAAIAGGANVITSPDMYLGLDRGHFLSHTNGCKPFDEAADGYGRAEGCGIFILKKLSNAIAENDRIHGVIKGIEANQSGNSHSITHPHSETQASLIRSLLSHLDIEPASIDVVEAHGTGTQAGDTREINTLRGVFESTRSKANPLIISSVKGSVGHCEAASGSAGLAKLLLMLKAKTVPPQANLKVLNLQLGDLANGNLIVPRELTPWEPRKSRPRRALLNNFGAAGSNVAMVVEEAVEPPRQSLDICDRETYLFNLSAKTEEALLRMIENFRARLESLVTTAESCLKDICYTTTARRQLYNHRISIKCSSIPDLRQQLSSVDLPIFQVKNQQRQVVFVFSGQGSLYSGMGKDLMFSSRSFKSSIHRCDNILKNAGYSRGVSSYIIGEMLESNTTAAEIIVMEQCSCVAIEYALAQMLESFGIKPHFLVGHSLGEYSALVVSKSMSLEDALRVVARRAELMLEHCQLDTSGMLACQISSHQVTEILGSDPALSELSVACDNNESSCVIAGPLEQIEVLQTICKTAGYKTKKLQVPFGFHSSAMEPIVLPLAELGHSISLSAPSVPVASNYLGRFVTFEDLTPDYFATHARNPVLFKDIIEMLTQEGVLQDSLVIEIGPHPTTLPMIKSSCHPCCQTFPAMQKGKDSWSMIYSILSDCFKYNDNINWRQTFEAGAKIVSLPGHSMMEKQFVVEYNESWGSNVLQETSSDMFKDTGFMLLPRQNMTAEVTSEGEMVYETTMYILGPHIKGHNVGGTSICPASVLFELASEAAQLSVPSRSCTSFIGQQMSFSHPLIYNPDEESKIIRVRFQQLDKVSEALSGFKVSVSVMEHGKETLCCNTIIVPLSTSDMKRNLLRDTAISRRQERHFSEGTITHNTFHKQLLYENLFTRVVTYSAEYQSISKFSLSNTNEEAIGKFQLPLGSHGHGCCIPPVFTDTLLHAAGFSANLSVSSQEICICGHIGSIEVLQDIDFSEEFTVCCTMFDNLKGAIVAEAIALNRDGEAVAAIRGIEFKKLQLKTFQRLLQGSAGRPAKPPTQVTSGPMNSKSSQTPTTTITIQAQTNVAQIGQDYHLDRTAKARNIVTAIISQLYGSDDIDESASLSSLGVDSLMHIEIVSRLREAFPDAALDSEDLLQCQNLNALVAQIVSAVATTASTPDSSFSASLTTNSDNDTRATSIDFEAIQDSNSEVHSTMIQIVGEVYGSTALDYSQSLESLGIDSLMQIEIASKLQEKYPGADIDHANLTQCGTLQAVGNLLQSLVGIDKSTLPPLDQLQPPTHITEQQNAVTPNLKLPPSPPRLLHEIGGNNLPLYLIHDGSGQGSIYSKIVQPDRNIFAFSDPNFLRESPNVTSLEDMAFQYASSFSRPDGRGLVIGGWSFGGVVAFQAAQYLSQRGFSVKGLILIDSPFPRNHEPLPAEVVKYILASGSSTPRPGQAGLVSEFGRNAGFLGKYFAPAYKSSDGSKIRTVYLRSEDTIDTQAACGVQYPWLSDQNVRSTAIQDWETLVGDRIKVLPIPGNHFEPFMAQNIHSTSKQILEACRYIEDGK